MVRSFIVRRVLTAVAIAIAAGIVSAPVAQSQADDVPRHAAHEDGGGADAEP